MKRGATPSGENRKGGDPTADDASLPGSDEQAFWAEAEQIIDEVIAMSDVEIADYLDKHGLAHLATPDHIDEILERASAVAAKEQAKGKSVSDIPGAAPAGGDQAIERQIGGNSIKGRGAIIAH